MLARKLRLSKSPFYATLAVTPLFQGWKILRVLQALNPDATDSGGVVGQKSLPLHSLRSCDCDIAERHACVYEGGEGNSVCVAQLDRAQDS